MTQRVNDAIDEVTQEYGNNIPINILDIIKQEKIILQNDPCLFKIPEYKLRTITDGPDWNNQHVMWQKLTQDDIQV